MKNTNPQNRPAGNSKGNHRPEIRDNLDSRKNEEQDFKGDDVTHKVKEQQHETKKIKQDKK